MLSILGTEYFLKIGKSNYEQGKPIGPNRKIVPAKHNK